MGENSEAAEFSAPGSPEDPDTDLVRGIDRGIAAQLGKGIKLRLLRAIQDQQALAVDLIAKRDAGSEWLQAFERDSLVSVSTALTTRLGLVGDTAALCSEIVATGISLALQVLQRDREVDPADDHRRRAVCVTLANVEPEAVSFLWRPYIPRGKLTLLEGDPGIGKSWLSSTIAAIVSRGWPFPDVGTGLPRSNASQPGHVIILNAEDGLEDTIRVRVGAVGADLSRVHVLTAWQSRDGKTGDIHLTDIDVLADAIQQFEPALVIVDPIVAYLGADVDLHRANETRPVLAGLARLAGEHRCAFLLIRHLSKAVGGRAIYRGLGSIDISAAARSVLLAGVDPEDEQQRAIVQVKSSLAPSGPAIGYALRDDRLEWTGLSDLTATRLLACEQTPARETKIGEAIDFLRMALASGPRPLKDLIDEAAGSELQQHHLYRASKRLQVKIEPSGFPRRTTWSLLPSPDASADAVPTACSTVSTVGAVSAEPVGDQPYFDDDAREVA